MLVLVSSPGACGIFISNPQMRERVATDLYIGFWHKHCLEQRPLFKLIDNLKQRLQVSNSRLKNHKPHEEHKIQRCGIFPHFSRGARSVHVPQ